MKFNIDRILKLSLLELEEEEKEYLKKEMEKIIDWVSKLEELDIEGEEVVFLNYSPLREDEPEQTLPRKDILPLQNYDGIFFIVPKVVEK